VQSRQHPIFKAFPGASLPRKGKRVKQNWPRRV
jgi:hypothetical protein